MPEAKHSGPLDFVVFGVPRSGTSGLARAFNAHPNAFCGMEFFRIGHDYSELVAPSCFLDGAPPAEIERNQAKRHFLKRKLGWADITKYGNKLPRYYLELGALKAHNPAIRSVAIYRDLGSVARSWTRRSEADGDRWPSGRRGIIALAEAFLLAARLIDEPDDVLIVNYRNAFYDDPELMSDVMDFVGLDGSDARFKERFRTTVFGGPRNRSAAAPETDADEALERAIAAAGVDELDAILLRAPTQPSSAVREALRSYVAAHRADLAGVVADYVLAADIKCANYLRLWCEQTVSAVDEASPAMRSFALALTRDIVSEIARRAKKERFRKRFNRHVAGRLAGLAGAWEEAIADLDPDAGEPDGNPTIHLERAIAYARLGEFAAAADAVGLGAAPAPHVRSLTQVATGLLTDGRENAAIWLLAEAIAHLEGNPKRETPLGRAYLSGKGVAAAEAEALEALRRTTPDESQAFPARHGDGVAVTPELG